MSEQLNPSEQEISSEQKREFYEKVRFLAPYDGQHIDNFGSYETRYEREDGYISIYMPVIAEAKSDEGLIDDAVRVIVRHEDELDNGLVIRRSESYTIHVTDDASNYDESIRVCDAETGERVGPTISDDPRDIINIYNLKNGIVSNVFSRERFAEVMTLLDSIDTNQRF